MLVAIILSDLPMPQVTRHGAVCREKASRFAAANQGTVAKDNLFKKAKTVFRCSSCLTFLCIREGSNCWMDFHSKVQYWR